MKTSSNRLELTALANKHTLYLENTFFQTKRACHQWTFRSANSTKYCRRLDYILVDDYLHHHSVNCRRYDPRISTDQG